MGHDDTKVFGFWIYLMTDLLIFAALFATFTVLHKSTAGGPSAQKLFDLPYALGETLILLTSSFTCALGMLFVHSERKKAALFWFGVTVLLGLSFLVFEYREFADFIHRGAGPERSAFLSAFFTLVGTHGMHIAIGLLWMVVALFQIALRPASAVSFSTVSFSPVTVSRLLRMALFWHFLDMVWIFIFTAVYGMGYLL